jgi:hypothetical protein
MTTAMSRELAIHGELALAGEYDGRRTPLPSFRDSHPSSQRVALRNLVHKAPQEHDAESGNRRLRSKNRIRVRVRCSLLFYDTRACG